MPDRSFTNRRSAAPPADPATCQTLFGFFPWPHLDTRNATGYATAWLHYVTVLDPVARPAFAGANPEILTNPNWTGETLVGALP